MLTEQPYIEFAWKSLRGLTITPDLKYTSVTPDLDAIYFSKLGQPSNVSQTWGALLPSIDAHYEIMQGWVGYAQAAEGFLTPPLNTLLVPAANVPASLKPRTTVNYQIGTVFRNDRVSAGHDMYYIQFQNYIAAQSKFPIKSFTDADFSPATSCCCRDSMTDR